MKIYTLLILASLLVSCSGLTGGLAPTLDIGKKQNNNSHSSNAGNGAGRDIKARIGLTAGDDKSSSYDNSNIKSNATNNDIQTSQDTSQVILGGKAIDKSRKAITNNTSDHNSSYANSVINNVIDSNKWFWMAIVGWVLAIIGWFLPTPNSMMEWFRK